MRFDTDLSRYEPLGDAKPVALISSHPSGQYVALQVPGMPLNRAAVWETATGRLVWAPPDTVALSWMPDGREMILIRYRYQRADDHPAMIVTPLQQEYSWSLERRSWPERNRLRACPLERLLVGWFDDVVLSPRGDLAAVYWLEQSCAGVDLVALGEVDDKQLEDGSCSVGTNWVTGPLFSPDGRYLLLATGPGSLWWAPAADEDPDMPSPGGRFRVGDLVVFNVDTREQQAVVHVHTDLPVGWLPESPESPETELLELAEFVTDSDFRLKLPTGDWRTLTLAFVEPGGVGNIVV
jgi:hypothetical protein